MNIPEQLKFEDNFEKIVVGALNEVGLQSVQARYSEEITEYRYCNALQSKIYYRPSYNGGLLYHGPAGGPTFAVTLTPVEGWSVHT